MAEASPVPIVTEEEKRKKDISYLLRLGRVAQEIYFGNALRTESAQVISFDTYKSIPEDTLVKVTEFLNIYLQKGGEVVILDFPYYNDLYQTRSQAMRCDVYLRQANFAIYPLREFEYGNFSLKLARPPHSNTTGALSLQVKATHGLRHKIVYETTWNEDERPMERFAVLTHKKGKDWSVILDFRLPDEGEPAWKLNSQIHSH